MRAFLWVLWSLPVAIPIWVLYIWPALALGHLRRAGQTEEGIAIFETTIVHDWSAQAWPGAIVINSRALLRIQELAAVVRVTMRRVRQWKALGLLYPVVFLLFALEFGGHNNPLDVDAREA